MPPKQGRSQNKPGFSDAPEPIGTEGKPLSMAQTGCDLNIETTMAYGEKGAMKESNSACLLCRSKDILKVSEIQGQHLVDEWLRSFGIDVGAELGDCKVISLLVCRNCGFRYFQPSTVAGSPALYAQLCRNDWYHCGEKWEHDVALRDVEGATKIIEIGCGSGEFIARARDEKGLSVEGLEQNPDAIERARRRGLAVFAADVRDLALERPAHYDVVCSFQVLEHVSEPREFLDACVALLRPGGKLLLGVPNSESFLRYQLNVLDLPPHHMSRWDAKVMNALPGMFPLRMRALEFEPLARNHVWSYLDAHASRLRPRSLLGRLSRVPKLLGSLNFLVIHSGARRLLLGHTLYVSFTRV